MHDVAKIIPLCDKLFIDDVTLSHRLHVKTSVVCRKFSTFFVCRRQSQSLSNATDDEDHEEADALVEEDIRPKVDLFLGIFVRPPLARHCPDSIHTVTLCSCVSL